MTSGDVPARERPSWRWPVASSVGAALGGLLVAYGAGLGRALGVLLVLVGCGPFALLVGPAAFVVFWGLSELGLPDDSAVGVPILMLLFGVPGVGWGLTMGEVVRRFRERRAA